MLKQIVQNSLFLQNLAVQILTRIHPSIEHNLAKIEMLKRAFFHCELEAVEGSYFEFGVYEGTSLYTAVNVHHALRSHHHRFFYGFDSFDEGFKYFNERDTHPFFREGDFKSSYAKVSRRFKKYREFVKLIPGFFENTIQGKEPASICGKDACAVAFIDCDLMGPALIALNFLRSLLRQGSVIIIDDYWAYQGDPNRGTCGALKEFLRANPGITLREYWKYGYGGCSFIVSSI